MCNAWNHSSDCRCGFGGEGHLGGGWGTYNSIADDTFINQIVREYRGTIKNEFDSFVIPNAHCPVCGAHVFYYQSPYGGRVFFDELQPPWPKHPCTDSSLTVKLIDFSKHQNVKHKKLKNNWYPLTLHKSYLKLVDSYILIAGSVNIRNSYQGFKEYLVENNDDLKYSNPLFYRDTSPDDFQLSTFIIEGNKIREIVLNGWKREKAIRMYPKVIKYLKIKVGDTVNAIFKGEYKGIHLILHPFGWQFKKNCLIDKIDLSDSKRKLIKQNPHENFEIKGLVTRITDGEIFIKEIDM